MAAPYSWLFAAAWHIVSRMFIKFEPDDFTMVVKNRAKPPKPWRWEIYRAGRDTPVHQSTDFFETMTSAHRSGKEGLKLFLAKRYA